jgi:alpha-galactosidase
MNTTSYQAFPIVSVFSLPGNPRTGEAPLSMNDYYKVFINITREETVENDSVIFESSIEMESCLDTFQKNKDDPRFA